MQFGLKFDHPEAVEPDAAEDAGAPALAEGVRAIETDARPAGGSADAAADASSGGAEVVSLDKFRKK